MGRFVWVGALNWNADILTSGGKDYLIQHYDLRQNVLNSKGNSNEAAKSKKRHCFAPFKGHQQEVNIAANHWHQTDPFVIDLWAKMEQGRKFASKRRK